MSTKRGRPKGSTNIDVSVLVEPSRCPRCGSSQRTKYENPKRVDFPGSGLDCIAIVYRTCRCADCGQARRDQEKVYAPAKTNLQDIDPRGEILIKSYGSSDITDGPRR